MASQLEQDQYQIIQKLNAELYDKYGDDTPIISLTFAGYVTNVELWFPKYGLEVSLYCSENETPREDESFRDFLKRRMIEIQKEVARINFNEPTDPSKPWESVDQDYIK